jgi:hypothetical protein
VEFTRRLASHQPVKATRALSKMRQAWRALSDDRWMPTWLVIAAFLSTGLARWVAA